MKKYFLKAEKFSFIECSCNFSTDGISETIAIIFNVNKRNFSDVSDFFNKNNLIFFKSAIIFEKGRQIEHFPNFIIHNKL